ncbi:ribosomal L28e protein family-domain-containing protein [Dactylonectria estremocensis]|uniref:Ribosomal L28e protein family-domain-containing protein n=1 Tax=Dactylonectria estremocensis TaxID=1079267 RepID=A0A9P9EVD3_9HYPO|nr:ribosomal L28e protein family-domain-containing protein [Dactylonectria estremocensis]
MASASLPNVSSDLIWEIVRNNNSFLAKSKKNGGIQFSRDPLNLTNKSSRKHAGFLNEKAIGVSANEKGGVVVTSKKAGTSNKPAQNQSERTVSKGSRKTYLTVANQTAKNGYRGDLRSAAVERASAIRKSQRPVKADQEVKLRGNKAKKAAAAEEN